MGRWPVRGRALRLYCVLAWLGAHGAVAALEPAELLTRIRGSSLVPEEAVALRNVRLEMGPAIFEMQRGILFPSAPIAGRTVELVFIGQARFLLEASDGGFIYDSASMNDDLPYYAHVQGKPWLVLPYSMETNDARFWRGGLVSINDFYDYLKDTFDCLYEEGVTHPKMMSVGLHCRIAGRPARSRAVDRFLRYTKTFPDVWFARRDEIATWWLEHYPFGTIQ